MSAKTSRLAFFLALVFSFCGPGGKAAESLTAEQRQQGQEIALDIRSMTPEENSEIRGILKIHSGKTRRQVPVICRVVVTNATGWQTIYEAMSTAQAGGEKLVVTHATNGPNHYLYARADKPGVALPALREISAAEASVPFAGSDFWLDNLGLEFLHWPEQARLRYEMRLGQPCHVLESRNPNGREAVRVQSWVDKESGGLLIAEAYDKAGRLVKDFSLSGSSFKKINGQWQLKKMTIRSPKADSETVLEWELPKD